MFNKLFPIAIEKSIEFGMILFHHLLRKVTQGLLVNLEVLRYMAAHDVYLRCHIDL